MSERIEGVHNVLVVGVGGQGILRLSDIISTAALLQGYQVKKSEVHGMAQRGGSVNSHVRYGPEVAAPLIPVGQAHIIIALEPLEGYRYLKFLSPQGVIVYDEDRILPPPVYLGMVRYPNVEERMRSLLGERAIAIPATKTAVSEVGNLRTQNVVMLGAAMRYLRLKREAIEEAIKLVFKGRDRIVEMNLRALGLGNELIEKFTRPSGESS